MRGRAILSAILGLGLAFPAWAEPGEDFPEGPKAGDGEQLPDSDESEMEGEQIDVVGTLEGILERMKGAEAKLAEAGSARALNEQGEAIESAEELAKSADLQKKAIERMTRIFDGGRKEQESAVNELERLIKSAKGGD